MKIIFLLSFENISTEVRILRFIGTKEEHTFSHDIKFLYLKKLNFCPSNNERMKVNIRLRFYVNGRIYPVRK